MPETDQATLDEKRRRLAADLIAEADRAVAQNKNAAAIVGAFVLAAGVLADRHGLNEVVPYILDDLASDADLLARGEWTPEDHAQEEQEH